MYKRHLYALQYAGQQWIRMTRKSNLRGKSAPRTSGAERPKTSLGAAGLSKSPDHSEIHGASERDFILHAPIIDHVFDPVLVWRLPGPIVFWNRSAENVYGYSKAEAVGRVSHELLHTVFPGGATAHDIESALAQEGEWMGELIHQSKLGKRVIVDARLKVASLSAEVLPALGQSAQPHPVVLEADRDITERQFAQAEARRRAGQQACMAALGRLAAERDDVDRLTTEAIRSLAAELNVAHIHILQYHAHDRSFTWRAGKGWLADALNRSDLISAVEAQAAFTIASGEPVISADLSDERRFSVPSLLRQAGAAASISTLIRDHPHPFGVLAVYSKQPREFTTDEIILLRSVSNLLAGAIQQNRSNRDLRDREARMSAVIDTALEGIITIDERGIIESANPAARQLFGYAEEELIGQNVKLLMPEPYHREHDGYMANYLRTSTPRIIGIGREVYGRRKDGSTFPLHLGVSEFRIGSRRMFTGQVRDITERRRLEREILEISAQEQRRIGQDLHDGLCQELTSVSFALEVINRKLTQRSAPEAAAIEQVTELIDQSISHARTLAHGLQPIRLDASGLETGLQELALKTEKMFRISCLFMSDQPVRVHDNVVATHAYHIAQEAIGNAIKHGKARTIMLELSAREGWLGLKITDDGVGLENTTGDGKGIGLQTMTYRASVVGGSLQVRPGDRSGTVVVCTIPLSQLNVDGDNAERATQHAGEEKFKESLEADSDRRPIAAARARGSASAAQSQKGLPGRRSSHGPRTPGRTDSPGT